ncbi:MAG: hypothetical protein DRI90_04825 [Deltaproteobacteria bacterium]|nr:MAG: hypothetical protein DRI90_04825 [Deltaproteobacteria bacterium]
MSPTVVQLERGAVIADKLRLLRPLGQGGMGSVWVAQHLGLDMEVAVKFIRPECVAYDPSLLPRFEREARAAAKISSPHVVHIKDYGVVDEHPYIVMELLRGAPLSDVIEREGRLSLKRVTPLVVEVAEALESAHQQGIVHRDIKPHNIVLTEADPGEPMLAKVFDFGVAKVVGEGPVAEPGAAITQTGTVIGSPPYMSPEQLEGRSDVDHRADIWALGVVTYQALTGALPFAGSTIVTVGAAVLRGEYEPASVLQPQLPAQLDDWFAKTLCLDRSGRFSSARELAEAFVAVVARQRAARRDSLRAGASPRAQARLAASAEALGNATTQLQARDGGEQPACDGDNGEPAGGTMAHAPRAMAPPPREPPAEAGASAGTKAGTNHGTTGSVTATRNAGPRLTWRRGAATAVVLAATVVAAMWLSDKRVVATPSPQPSALPAVVITPDSCPAGMRFIGGGTFAMGSDPADETRTDETPKHSEAVASFCLDETEVTVAAYAACRSCTPAAKTVYWEGITPRVQSFWGKFCNGNRDDRQNHPVNCVDWHQAKHYCAAQNRRLPREEEWEYAARGSDGRDYPWGNELPSGQRLNGCGTECAELLSGLLKEASKGGWNSMYDDDDGFPATAPVGHFPKGATAAGLTDMAGNVWEWTLDPYCLYDRPDCGESRRVLRGGAWNTPEGRDVRVARRHPGTPEGRSHIIGLRCAWPAVD